MSNPTPATTVATDSAVEAPPRKYRRSSSARHANLTGWAFMAPFSLLFILIFIIPICVSVYTSFFRDVATGGGAYGGGELVRTFVGFENYKFVLTNDAFWHGMGRVILYTCFQVPIMIIAALALALFLDSWLVKRVTTYRLGYFLPYAIPGVVASMIWLYLYSPELSPIVKGLHALGLDVDFLSRHTVLASMANMTTWTFTGYNMLIFLAALQAIPRELYEAARLDGATGWQVTRHVKLPMVRGAALLAVLLSIIGTIQLFNEPTVLATSQTWMGKDYTPMMMAYNTMMGTLTPGGDGPASAIAIVMALIAGILAVLYAIIDRRLTK